MQFINGPNYSGAINRFDVGEALSGGDFIYLSSDGKNSDCSTKSPEQLSSKMPIIPAIPEPPKTV